VEPGYEIDMISLPLGEEGKLVEYRVTQVERLETCKRASLKVVEYYALSEDEKYKRYAEKILNCSPRLEYVIPPVEYRRPSRSLNGLSINLELQHAERCHIRHCPMCQRARVDKMRAKMFQSMPRIKEDYPEYRFLFLTLTVLNCNICNLGALVNLMYKGWKRMTQRAVWPAEGYIKSLEVTMPWDCYYDDEYLGRMGKKSLDNWIKQRSKHGNFRPRLLRTEPTDEAHPHIHALLMVPPGYFGSRNYIDQKQWTQLWQDCARLDYKPIVNIKAVKPDTEGGSEGARSVLEVVKYTTKPEDMASSAEWLYGLTEQMHKVRAVSVGGVIADYVSQAVLNRIDDSITAGDEQKRVGTPIVFEWVPLKRTYLIRQLGDEIYSL
jgi:plasmid rolling circle replication initiator protein Rep